QAHMFDVFHDADDFVFTRRIPVTHVDKHMRTQRILATEELALQSLIDDDGTRRMLVGAVSDVASTHEWNLHGFKIAWSDPAMLREGGLTSRDWSATCDRECGPRDHS